MKDKLRQYRHVIKLFLAVFCLFVCIGSMTLVSQAYTETPGTVTVDSAKVRDKADAGGAVIGSVKKDGKVSICGEETASDGTVWYQVYVDADTKGYIRSDLVSKSGSSSSDSSQSGSEKTTSSSSSSSKTEVTAMDKTSAQVASDSVRIRSGASTSNDVVATAKKGLALTVTGKAQGSDGKEWYQVTFSYNNETITGFVRSDFVSFEAVSTDAATTEITGSEGKESDDMEEEMTTEVSTEENETEDVSEAEMEEGNSSVATTGKTEVTLLNTDEVPYVLPEFEPVVLKWNDQEINAWKNGEFYLFYAQKGDSDQGWYLYDQAEGVYERYVYGTETATVPSTNVFSGNILLPIVLGIIIIILLAVSGILFIKLREAINGGDHDYDDYGDDEDDFDDIDDFAEDDFETPRGRRVEPKSERVPVRGKREIPGMPNAMERPVRTNVPVRKPSTEGRTDRRPEGGAPVRRPVAGEGQKPVRRPVAGEEQRPIRRPEGSAPVRRPVAGEGQRPVRRPDGSAPVRRPTTGEGQHPVRRPDSMQSTAQRRPKNFMDGEDIQPSRPVAKPKRTQPARNEADDMEFIDI